MTELAFAISLTALFQEWADVNAPFRSAKKDRELRAWLARNPRFLARVAAAKPYNYVRCI